MRTWIVSQVSRALILAACLAACDRTHAPAPAGSSKEGAPIAAPGTMVAGVYGTHLATAPGLQPSQTSYGAVALVVDSKTGNNDKTWLRVIASDGVAGWTDRSLTRIGMARVVASAAGATLNVHSPDDAAFVDADGRALASGMAGNVIGASVQARAADLAQLKVPARLRTAELPWLHVDIGGMRGYAPLGDIAFTWKGISLHSNSASFNFAPPLHGLITGSFLAPMRDPLRTWAMAARPSVLITPEAEVQPNAKVERTNLEEPAALFIDGDAMLGAFSGPSGALFVGINQAPTVRLDLAANEDRPSVARVMRRDLNHDDRPEWLLEVVRIYGDGFYSQLWIVDGRATAEHPQVEVLSLSRQSGESNDSLDVDWRVSAEGILQLHDPTSGSILKTLRYTDRLQPIERVQAK